MYKEFVEFTRGLYQTKEFIPLHAPVFSGNEKKYLNECIDSTFVSSAGQFVNDFENKLAEYTGAKYAVVTSNGTSALHLSLVMADVNPKDIVITQALSFIATSNAIAYTKADSVFIDVDADSMSLSPTALKQFLEKSCSVKNKQCILNETGQVIKACVPMHTFGFTGRIQEIKLICEEYHIALIEDAAESIGSYYKNVHTGLFGICGTLSFNGNKTITSGGGGAIITNNEEWAKKAKHLSTQAKVPHEWEFKHDHVGYNYRMPNVNAALALAQLEQLNTFLQQKKTVHAKYAEFFSNHKDCVLVEAIDHTTANYWLNTVLLKDRNKRDEFLRFTNDNKVMTRPTWTLMHKLPMFNSSKHDGLKNSIELEDRIVNIPSSAIAL